MTLPNPCIVEVTSTTGTPRFSIWQGDALWVKKGTNTRRTFRSTQSAQKAMDAEWSTDGTPDNGARILHGLTFDEYLQLPGWNWSLIKLLDSKSPKAVQHAKTTDDDTASRIQLRAVHCLALEPDNFDASFALFEGARRGTKAYDAFVEQNPGKDILKTSEHEQAKATADAYRSHPAAAELLASGKSEVVIIWTDEETGLPCKCRIDWLSDTAFVDLKTLGTTHERQVGGLVARNLWHGQSAHYNEGLKAVGLELPAFIIAAEGKGAQDVAVFTLDPNGPHGALHVGRLLRARLMERLAECVATDLWPGRHPETQTLALPMYALPDTEIDFDDDFDDTPNIEDPP